MSKQFILFVRLTRPTIFIRKDINLCYLLSNQINLNVLSLWSDRTRKVLGQCPHLRDKEVGA